MPAIYPDLAGGKRPWWAAPFASSKTRSVMGWFSALMFCISIVYGFRTINAETLTSETRAVKVQVSLDGANQRTSTLTLPGWQESRRLTRAGEWKAALLIFWIVVPPIWFWFEYVLLYRYDEKTGRESAETFQYTQDVASKIWLALVTALTILYFGKDIRV